MSVNIYDKENNKLIRTADMLVEGGGGEVIDNLTSTDIDKALSANQGRVLNEKIGFSKAISDAYDSSTTYSAGQYCIYNNMLWRSLLDNNLANTPAEGTYWTTTSVSKNLITKNGEGKFGYLGADDSFIPFKSGEEPVLLWENPNPTSAFDAQKIDLDLSEYDNVIISVATINGSAGQMTINNVLLPKNLSTIVGISGSYSGNNIGTRQVRIIDDTGITFGYGSYRGKAPSADDRGWGIPQKIWGVPTKFEVVTKNIAMQEWLTASMTTAYTITKDYEYVTILSGNTVTFSGNIGETLVAKQQIIGTSSYYYYIFKDVRSGTKFTPASTSYGMQITAIPYV